MSSTLLQSPVLPWRHIHFVGVGGVGMSGLAWICLRLGLRVSGSDATESAGLRRLLIHGAQVAVGHAADNLGSPDLLVYSSAIPVGNPERLSAVARGIPCLRRGEFLAELCTRYRRVIAVSGSHGKTTTTAMLAHILRADGGYSPGFLIGGEVSGWDAPAAVGDLDVLVTEVDESDGTQSLVQSHVALVLNMDDDHAWSVGGPEALYASFRTLAARAERVLATDTPSCREVLGELEPMPEFVTVPADDVRLPAGQDAVHNRANATIAVRAAIELGVDRAMALRALATFPGVERRLTEWYRAGDDSVRVLEDYAHHPTELECLLTAVRDRFPNHHLTAIFQPHRFERVRRYASAFGAALSQHADHTVLLPPFAAWLDDGTRDELAGLTGALVPERSEVWHGDLAGLADHLVTRLQATNQDRVLLVVGAGSVGALPVLVRDALNAQSIHVLCNRLRGQLPEVEIETTRTWADLTSLRLGRARPAVVHPRSELELCSAIGVALEAGVPTTVLGLGTNLIGADHEPARLMVSLDRGEFTTWAWQSPNTRTLCCGAGLPLPRLVRDLMARERCGPRFAVLGWIPGSVGGAVRMNAGAHGSEFGEFVHRIKGIDARTGAVVTLDGRDVRWEYRRAGLPSDLIVTQVVLRPDAADHGKTLAAYETAGAERRARQPRTAGVGSVFRNAGTTAAGLLLDRCGCKGMSHGAVRISPRHANFVEAGPGAVERDLVTLLLRARHLVLQKTGVRLMPEVVCADPDSEQRLCHSPRAYHAVVLKGGPSSERIVSLKSGVAVATALRQAGYRVTEIDVTEARLPDLPEDTDVVFPALHGAFGEDGQVQALLEAAGVPYVGSDSQASALIMSKTRSKACVTAAGIPTPRAFPVLSADAPVPAELRFPAIVKPDCQGSTVGMTRLLRPSSWWRRALRKAFAVDSGVFVEEFITGTEITVGLLDGTPLPVVEIVPPKGRMFDYDAKYDHRRGHTHYLCPPEAVSEAVQARAQELAATAYKALGAKDMLRVDFIVDAQGAPWFLEANSLPGFTGTSLLPMAASRHGLSFVELCAHLVHTNLRDR